MQHLQSTPTNFPWNLIRMITAESYNAESVKDFLDNRQDIQTTSFLKVFYAGSALIAFSNVDLLMGEEGSIRVKDITGEYGVHIEPEEIESLERQGFARNRRYNFVLINYHPETDYACLRLVEPFGGEENDRSGSLDKMVMAYQRV